MIEIPFWLMAVLSVCTGLLAIYAFAYETQEKRKWK